MATNFESLTEKYIEALREVKAAHAEIMQSHNEDSKRRYSAARKRVEELDKSWHDEFQKASRT